jgi:hypothetical protein
MGTNRDLLRADYHCLDLLEKDGNFKVVPEDEGGSIGGCRIGSQPAVFTATVSRGS